MERVSSGSGEEMETRFLALASSSSMIGLASENLMRYSRSLRTTDLR